MKTLTAALLMAALLTPAPSYAAAPVACKIITHRAIAPDTDEEQPAGITYSKRFRWGAEIDARLSADGTPWAIHDSGLGRITGGKDKRKVINMTDAQLRKVRLIHGGRPWTVAALMRHAATKKVGLAIELKPVPPGAAIRWDHAPTGTPTGLDRLASATTGRVLWTTARPDVWGHLTSDDRFSGRLLAKEFAWTPTDPTSYAGLRMAYLTAQETTQTVVDALTAAGVTPLRRDGGKAPTKAAIAAGVRTFVSHYPARTRATCNGG